MDSSHDIRGVPPDKLLAALVLRPGGDSSGKKRIKFLFISPSISSGNLFLLFLPRGESL